PWSASKKRRRQRSRRSSQEERVAVHIVLLHQHPQHLSNFSQITDFIRCNMQWFTFACLFIFPVIAVAHERPAWTWTCENKKCEKKELLGNDTPQSMAVCKLLCDPNLNLWPRPTGEFRMSQRLVPVNPHSISVEYVGSGELKDDLREIIQKVGRLFQTELGKEAGVENLKADSPSTYSLFVELDIKDPKSYRFTSDTDEGYQLLIGTQDTRVKATITAQTYFGARHGLETLSQLVIYDDVSRHLVVPDDVYLNDRPAYPYRGILLDTSRSYFSVKSIKRTLDAMAANKLNTFHWHMTDSHSFPFQSKKYPQFSHYGAYTPRKVYTHDDIRSIVEYGRVRGVRVLPELDQPAHVGEGWQWAPNTTVCFKAEPWQQYCVEPPCGQLDPTNDYVYDILGNLYSEFLELFDSDIFHMGGDEVNFNCWNSSETITKWMANNNYGRSEADFIRLWKNFQERSYARLIKANGGKQLPVVLWTSHLTLKGQVHLNLEKEKYIIQIWTKGNDEIVPELVNQGFRVIFSNYEALYFDCGFGAWVGAGNNWCSPYIGWQKVYDNDPLNLLKQQGVNVDNPETQKLVWGAEATLFTEQADEAALDSRLWPRASALAERLWSRPSEDWHQAEFRILEQRERLVRRGIMSDLLEPEWCVQNQGYCYL
ncbi:Chitooligosaccharidolytic beta-N-acetylglucosaminidase, partial [Gryllus bimaculatus]